MITRIVEPAGSVKLAGPIETPAPVEPKGAVEHAGPDEPFVERVTGDDLAPA